MGEHAKRMNADDNGKDSALEDIHAFIAYRVQEGFESTEKIVENAIAYAEETLDQENLQAEIEQITAALLAEHRERQAHWETPTDCDRLDQAFAALNERGIVARQDFSCCTACGHSDIWDEIEQVEETQRVDGYVFYHFQCVENAIAYGQLLLAYGSVVENEQVFKYVGKAIVAELCKAGLDAKWDGSPNSPILVNGIVWQRRR